MMEHSKRGLPQKSFKFLTNMAFDLFHNPFFNKPLTLALVN